MTPSGRTETVLLSVALSALMSLAMNWRSLGRDIGPASPKSSASHLQGETIDLTDKRGIVRSTLEVTERGGHEQPQLTLKDEAGQTAVILTLDQMGQGYLAFNSRTKEGRVLLGYVETGDTPGDYQNDGTWGIRILGADGQATGIGIRNSGVLIQPTVSAK